MDFTQEYSAMSDPGQGREGRATHAPGAQRSAAAMAPLGGWKPSLRGKVKESVRFSLTPKQTPLAPPS